MVHQFILCYLLCLLTPLIGQAIGTDLSYILIDIIDQTLSHQIELNDTKSQPSIIDEKIHLGHVGSFHHSNPFKKIGKTSKEAHLPYDTLIIQSPRNRHQYIGLLAQNIQIDYTSHRITFYINPQARFHNGQAVTAKDVKASIEHMITQGPWHYRHLQDLKPKITNQNNHTLLIECTQPINLDNLVSFGLIPIAQANSLDQQYPVGSGPYSHHSSHIGSQTTFKKQPDYWAKDMNFLKSYYNFDQVISLYYRNQHTALEAFKRHEYDFRVEYYHENWIQLQKFNKKKTDLNLVTNEEIKPIHMQGLMFNLSHKPWHDKEMRKALANCFDFEKLNTSLFHNRYQRITSYFTHTPYQAQKNYQKPQHENALIVLDKKLSKAGWVVENHRRQHRITGEKLTITLLIPHNHTEKVAHFFAQGLSDIGIEVIIQSFEPSQYLQALKQGAFDLAYTHLTHNPLSTSSLKNIWLTHSHPLSIANLAHINDTEINTLLTHLENQPEKKDKITTLKKLDNYLLDQYFIIPFWYQNQELLAYWNTIQKPESYHSHQAWLGFTPTQRYR